MPQFSTKNLTNELAKARNRDAAERTLMAWIRTCLSLIGFGVGIDRIVHAIYSSWAGKMQPAGLTRILSLLFIGLGLFAMVVAMLYHRQELKRIQRDDYVYQPQSSLSLLVGAALLLIGIFAFFNILLAR